MAEIHDRKNADYATNSDPFSNFRACEGGGVPVLDGVLARASDKWSRFTNLHAKERHGIVAAVSEETLEDTLLDLANYALIYVCLRRERDSRG